MPASRIPTQQPEHVTDVPREKLRQPDGEEPTVTRVVLLGASNLTLAFPLVLEHLQAGIGGPLEVFAAYGHGRSYGNWSRVLFRELPGIAGCELWRALDDNNRPVAPPSTLGLVTDVGNDLLYGAEPAQIAEWVTQCLGRLAEQQAEIVLTLLPLASIKRLSPLRYHLTRMLFFPGRGTAWNEMLARARELNNQVAELGRSYGAHLIEQPLDWYGFDPIHIRPTRRADAWRQICSGWGSFDQTAQTAAPKLGARLVAHTRRPAVRRLFGRGRRAPQPALERAGARVWLY